MFNILQYWQTGRRVKKTSSDWYTGNGPCCIHNGETADKRGRCGVKVDGDDWVVHCFNCRFKTKFVYGEKLSKKARNFLKWLNVPEPEIMALNVDSLRNKTITSIIEERKPVEEVLPPVFINPSCSKLPNNFIKISGINSNLVKYLNSRRIDYSKHDFYCTPNASGREKNRIIIPYTHMNKIVGYSSKFLDDANPRYINNQPNNYVYGLDFQNPNWQYAFVMEGIFDALSIDGIAVLHNDINVHQATRINMLRAQGKEIIVIPDQDKSGMAIIEAAIKNGYSVSIPNWPKGIKDVNDAVVKYGKLATIMMILKNKEQGDLKIKLQQRALLQKLTEREEREHPSDKDLQTSINDIKARITALQNK